LYRRHFGETKPNPAMIAGMLADDVIEAVNGLTFETVEELIQAMQSARGNVSVLVLRD
jgi:hypothetical protein